MRASKGTLDLDYRKELAGKVFNVTKKYDQAISAYFSNVRTQSSGEFPENLNYSFRLKSSMRYGENPHQSASFYCDETFTGPTLANGRQLAGKELSYNNIGDLDACLEMLLDFTEPFACVLKHANPCGAAVGETIADAYRDALASDPLSAFGSIIGLNKQVDMAAAKLLHDTFFVECILAPGFDEDALALLKKKSTRRLLVLPDILKGRPKGEKVFKYVRGGLLLQTADDHITDNSSLEVVTNKKPTEKEIRSLLFAWKIVKHTKSNAIVIVKDSATVGIGMGQTSRVDASALAVKRAGDRAKGAVLASDAFFPMPDGAEVALQAGVSAIIQPGGSKGDDAVIEVVNKYKAAMVFTGIRHFKH